VSSQGHGQSRADISEHGHLEKRGVSVDTMTAKRKQSKDEWVDVDPDSQSLRSKPRSIIIYCTQLTLCAVANGTRNGKADKSSKLGGY
jgi:hypothetical protein